MKPMHIIPNYVPANYIVVGQAKQGRYKTFGKKQAIIWQDEEGKAIASVYRGSYNKMFAIPGTGAYLDKSTGVIYKPVKESLWKQIKNYLTSVFTRF